MELRDLTLGAAKRPRQVAADSLMVTFGLPTCLILLSVLIDQVPRFMQGDSVSYLMTGAGWIPPDRSWAFGFAVHWLLKTTRNYQSYILINNALLIALIIHCRSYFPDMPRPAFIYVACAVAIAVDPLIAVYTRFYLSDFLGLVFFVGFVGAFRSFLLDRTTLPRAVLSMAAFAVGAVFTRVAYALIIGLTVAVVLTWACFRASAPVRWRAASALLLPCVAVASLAAANSAVFSQQFGHKPFVNKLSGAFLMGVFAPALAKEDFENAGIHLSDGEFADLELSNFDKRGQQVWGSDARSARFLVMSRLGVSDQYSDVVDKTCRHIALNAVRRNPVGFLGVYLKSVSLYFSYGEWKASLDAETGVNRPLDTVFIKYINHLSTFKLYPDIVREESPMMTMYKLELPFYPIYLIVCLVAALYNLLRNPRGLTEVILSAAFIATFLAAGLYSNNVIPRYVLGSVFLGYLLLALLVQAQFEHRNVAMHLRRLGNAATGRT